VGSKRRRKDEHDRDVVRALRRARSEALEADVSLRNTVELAGSLVAEGWRLCDRLAAVSAHLRHELAAAEASTVPPVRRAEPAPAPVPPAPVPAPVPAVPVDDDLHRRIDQLLVAQRRTNELLELALGATFDAELGTPMTGTPVTSWHSEVGDPRGATS
jgi:hypothetical protein